MVTAYACNSYSKLISSTNRSVKNNSMQSSRNTTRQLMTHSRLTSVNCLRKLRMSTSRHASTWRNLWRMQMLRWLRRSATETMLSVPTNNSKLKPMSIIPTITTLWLRTHKLKFPHLEPTESNHTTLRVWMPSKGNRSWTRETCKWKKQQWLKNRTKTRTRCGLCSRSICEDSRYSPLAPTNEACARSLRATDQLKSNKETRWRQELRTSTMKKHQPSSPNDST